MTKTLISIDLDWLNDQEHAIDKLKELLRHIPKNTPTIMTIEHHEFLPQLRQWIKSGKVPIPFNILNIDEHHDYYLFKDGDKISCGNWGYHIPIGWYDEYTWVHNGEGVFHDWESAQEWLRDRNILHSVRDKHLLSDLNTEIVAAIFCVSPDYLRYPMIDLAADAIEIIVEYFQPEQIPRRISGTSAFSINGWRLAPRPLSTNCKPLMAK